MGAMNIIGAVAFGGFGLIMDAIMGKPKIKPIKISASTYGRMRPITNGTNEIGANVLWQTDIELTQDTVGKGAGGGTIIRGKASFMLGFGEGPRDVRQIWADGKLIYDNRPGAKKKKKYKAPIRIYQGTEDDLPDPFMEAKLGVGLVQAYRGEVHVMLENLPLEDFGNRPPNFTAEIVELFSPEHHVTSIIGFEQGLSFYNAFMLDPREDKPLGYATERGGGATANSTLLAKINTLTGEIMYEMPVLDYYAGNGISSDIDNDGNIYSQINGPRVILGFVSIGKIDGASGTLVGFFQDASGGEWFNTSGNIVVDRASDAKLIAHWSNVGSPTERGNLYLFDQEGLHEQAFYPPATYGIPTGGRAMQDVNFDKDGNCYVLVAGSGHVEVYKADGGLVCDLSSHFTRGTPHYILWYAGDNSLIVGGSGELVKWSLDDDDFVKRLEVTITDSGFRTFHNPRMQDSIWLPDVVQDTGVSVPPGSLAYFPAFQEIDLNTLSKKRFEVFTEASTIYPIPGYTYFSPIGAQYDPQEDVIWSEAFPELAIGKFSLRGGASCVTLQSVVDQYSTRVGLTPGVDTYTDLLADDEVCGYTMTERQPCRSMLEPLLTAHGVDVYETDKIYFIPRGSASAITIPQKDLAAHSPTEQRSIGDLLEVRKEERELPESIDITFFRQFDYEQGHARAFRDKRNIYTLAEQQIEFPEVFSGKRAQDIADRLLYEAWIGRTTYELSLGPKYWKLNPTDVITVLVSGVAFQMRLNKVDIGLNWVVKCEAVAVDVAVYDGMQQAPGPVIQPPSGGIPVNSPTILALLDVPMLRESDNDAGFYVAVAPELGTDNTNWGGSVIFKSFDGMTYSNFMEDTAAATMGYAVTALPSVDRPTVWDENSVVRVKLYNGEPENITRTDQLNEKGVWVIGKEICQPGTFTQIDANTWDFGPPWIRGRRGTEWAVSTHVAGEQVVLLDTATIRRAFQPNSEINQGRFYEAVSYGDSTDGASPQAFTDTAESLMPYSPVNIQGSRDMSNNLTITWTRRSRFSNVWTPLSSPPLGEESEKYLVDVLDGDTVLRTIPVTAPTAPYSAADQTTDGLTPGDPVVVRVAQVSAIVGKGFERSATI